MIPLTFSGDFLTSKPPISTVPPVALTSVAIILMSVVLPAPFGPTIVKNSPPLTEKLTLSSTVMLPKFFVMS
ncbi:MAG: hypothetical protein C5S52_08815 [ANME-2 cluster archaeon]|nr:hypothetical protein [ANME-2 cluster archaeon]